MNKGQRVRESSIAVDVEQGKSYYWCSLAVSYTHLTLPTIE